MNLIIPMNHVNTEIHGGSSSAFYNRPNHTSSVPLLYLAIAFAMNHQFFILFADCLGLGGQLVDMLTNERRHCVVCTTIDFRRFGLHRAYRRST
jgi:hypothetical protein